MRNLCLIAILVLLFGGLSGCERVMEGPRPVIALITDFGSQDWYVSQMKGAILQVNPNVRIVDLSHDLQVYDIKQASFVVEKSAAYFPAGTIFVVVGGSWSRHRAQRYCS